jgi:hypothetical protein
MTNNSKEAYYEQTKQIFARSKIFDFAKQFIVRYDESDCNKGKIVKDAYLFCDGYFLKYQQEYQNPYLKGPSNIIAVLSSALLSPNFYAIPLTVSLERVLYFYKFIIEYIIWNEYEVERIFTTQKQSYTPTPELKSDGFKMKKRV